MSIQIELEFKGKILKGILIKEDEDYFTVKLLSGYNANLRKSESKVINRNEFEESKKVIFKEDKNVISDLPKIVILHTGGTIASKVDYRTGAVSSKFTPEELLSLYPELLEKANIDAKMVANIFSEDMRFAEYNLLLKEIIIAIEDGAKGIIISHGTDTMHYTSAALEYAMDNLLIPILLVGAQRSSDRASSDAFSNLDVAVDFILDQVDKEKQFRRVGICMHEGISDDFFLILDGINARKMHSTRRDAFKQVNYKPFARVHKSKIEIFREELLSEKPKENFSFTLYDASLKVGFFKVHPNMFAWELENMKNYDIVVIEGTGIGNIAEHEDNMKKDGKILVALEKLTKSAKVFSGVQTVYGEISLDIYSRGRDIQKMGVIGNRVNLTTENILMRAAYCLSQKEKSFEECWNDNLEGFEIRSEDLCND